jgi:fucokinase
MAETAAFDCVIVTASDEHQSSAYLQELRWRQCNGCFPGALIIAVPDPKGARIGSGGATLNALVMGAQALAAQTKGNASDPAWLQTKRFLVLHSGGMLC